MNNPDSTLLKAVIVYDWIVFAAKVGSLLRRVGARAGVQVKWRIKCWPMRVLDDIDSAKKALFQSRDAHLVVLPVRYARSVPTRLFDWLNEWAQQREICDAALGFTTEGNSANPPEPVCFELSFFIRQHGLHLITGQGLTTKDAIRIHVGFSPEREASVFIGTGNRRTAGLKNLVSHRRSIRITRISQNHVLEQH